MTLKKELDREMTSKFNLQIRAYSLASQNKVERRRRSIGKFPNLHKRIDLSKNLWL